jgi:hypothetical protein
MTISKLITLATISAFGAISAQAQTNTLFLNLRTGSSSTLNGQPAGVSTPVFAPSALSNSASCAGNWFEATVQIDLSRTEKKIAHVTVEYEGASYGWTAHIGDSPTNDGFGGNAGGPERNAEVQVVGNAVSAYSTGLGPGLVDLLLQQQKQLTDGSIRFTIQNQKVTIGQPNDVVQTPNSKLLFAIPDPAAGAANASKIYAAFNRVVANNSRNGCGARSIAIWTE